MIKTFFKIFFVLFMAVFKNYDTNQYIFLVLACIFGKNNF